MITKEQVQEFVKANQPEKIIEHAADILAGDDEEIKHALGMAYFHTKDYAHATPVLLQVAEKRNHSSSWFHVCTSAVGEKNYTLAETAYTKSLELLKFEKNTHASIPVPMMSYMYLTALAGAGQYAMALPILDKLKNNYKSIFISNDHFAASRNLPFFTHFLQTAKHIFQNISDTQRINTWIDDFKSGIDTDGKEKLEKLRSELEL
jgi:tetratricopeptide (TPR) repeat protein